MINSLDSPTRQGILGGMWLGGQDGVEIPEKLVSAHSEDSLVLFVGAGASVEDPSNLPKFRELTDRLHRESERPPPPEGAALERALGVLKRNGVNVHQKVHDIIEDPESEPNGLHQAIASLALASSSPRVITTNYDRHLSECLGEDVEEFPSMAFPQREDFTGIVYLHGSVREFPEHLVVTDADFGSVYLEAPWTAAQFLSRIFRTRTVLFIGYSHNDTLMEYLARALPPESDRFAFCADTEEERRRWGDLGVVPIGCATLEALPQHIHSWAERARMGILEHQQRIRAIVETPPPLSREDESYLQETLESKERLKLFTQNARGVEWLKWAENHPTFCSIFNPEAEYVQQDYFADWFAHRFAAGPDQQSRDEALSAFHRQGGTLSRGLWQAIGWRLGRPLGDGGEVANSAKRWIPLLIDHFPGGSKDLLFLLLEDLDPQDDRNETLLLLDCLLEPKAVPFDSSFALGGPSLRVTLDSSSTTGHYWKEKLRPCLRDEEFAAEVATIVDRHLKTAHRIVAACGDEQGQWISLSLERSAIEDHEQNLSSREGIDLLVRVARDTLESLLGVCSQHAGHYLRSWGGCESPLLRRLAIHGWIERQDITADEKINWLRDSGWLFDVYLKHESMRLLKEALPRATQECVDALVHSVALGPHETTNQTHPGGE